MSKKTITVPREHVDRIQALQYECDSRQDLLTYMLDRGAADSEGFQAYHREYTKLHAEYERAKEEMQKNVLEPQIDGTLTKWNLDFASGEAVCEFIPE